MTDEELEAIERRANAATPGPWYDHNVDDDYCMNAYVVTTSERDPDVGVDERTNSHKEIIALTLQQTPRLVDHESALWDENAAFIAHARTDIPALIAYIRTLQATVAALEASSAFQIGSAIIQAKGR